jgi:transcriptional regulator with XRE-family HTH domain
MRRDDVMALAQRISHERLRRGWSRSDLARKAGLDPSYVTRVEQGKFAAPSVEKIQQLADALRVPMATLTEPPQGDDDDALLRRLIERRIGSDNVPLVEALLDQLRDRPAVDQQALLGVVAASLRLLPPHTAR